MIAILMKVFEEVDGIERMKAFGLSLGIAIAFLILTMVMLSPRR